MRRHNSLWLFEFNFNEYGNPRTNNTLYRHCHNAAEAIGVEGFTFHDLRHTFATHFLAAQGDIESLKTILGHVSAAFTLDRYGHATEEMMRRSAAKLGEHYRELLEPK